MTCYGLPFSPGLMERCHLFDDHCGQADKLSTRWDNQLALGGESVGFNGMYSKIPFR